MLSKIKKFLANKLQKKINERQFSPDDSLTLPAANDELPLIANPGLIAAINALKNEENSENRIRFRSLMRESRFILAITQLNPTDNNNKLIFDHVEDEENNHSNWGIALTQRDDNLYYNIFTDMNRFETWRLQHDNPDHNGLPKSQPNLITFANLYALTMETPTKPYGILINAKNEDFLVKHELLKLTTAHAYLPQTTTEEQNATFMPLDASNLSKDLVEELDNYLKKILEIHAVWIVIMVIEQQQYFTLLIDFSGHSDNFISPIIDICARHIGEDEKITVIPAYQEPFKSLVEQFTPIFIRAN